MDFEEINEPVDMYQKRLKAEYEQNSEKMFEEFVAKSGVDEKLNAEKINEINAFKSEIAKSARTKIFWGILRFISWLVAIAGLWINVAYFWQRANSGVWNPDNNIWMVISGLVFAIASLYLIFAVLNKKIRILKKYISDQKAALDGKLKEAWAQMEPLNRLFQWNTIADLIMKTVPIFKMDEYFSNARFDELVNHFGLHSVSDQNSSMLCCQSGALNGNPFVICTSKDFHMGTQDYHGSLQISWQERESYTDSNGNRKTRWVTKHQTLHATITKPKPMYDKNHFLIYGNEAAPNLSFSRAPSSLSDTNGLFSSMRLKMAVKGLKKKSQKLDGFMAMNNTEFDAVFGALDRDNEMQFRLLFTPLAQREMLKLLRDDKVGFGDDFIFTKSNQINIIQPEHFTDSDLSCNPNIFRHYDVAEARKIFREYSTTYFHSFFFAFAPILAIPLYQQHRSDLDIYRDVYGSGCCTWECETIANDFGQHVFRHEDCITDNILKIKKDGSQVSVTAHGFRGVNRTEYVSVYGGDGRNHNVPVEWIEYIAVQRTSPMVVKETGGLNQLEFEEKLSGAEDWQEFFRTFETSLSNVKYRRSLISFIRK